MKVFDYREWMRDANCAGLPQDVFFSEDSEDLDSAKIICSRCTVQAQCLAYAFETDESMREGIYGGTTGQERTDYARTHDLHPGRITDRLRSTYKGRAWEVQDPGEGDESENWLDMVGFIRRPDRL